MAPASGRVWLQGLWLQECGSASRVCLDIRAIIAKAGMRYSFGIVQLSGKLGEKWKYYKVSRKEPEAWGWEGVCFFVSPRVMMAEGETHGE